MFLVEELVYVGRGVQVKFPEHDGGHRASSEGMKGASSSASLFPRVTEVEDRGEDSNTSVAHVIL